MCSERSPLCPLASRRPRSERTAKRPYRSRRRHNAPRRKTRRTPARTPQPSGRPRIQPCPGRLETPTPIPLRAPDAELPGRGRESPRWRSSFKARAGGDRPQQACRIACHDRVGRHVASHDAAGSDQSILADRDVRKDGGAGADRSARPHQRRLDFPVLLGLQRTVRSCGARVGVVDEGDAVADEDVVLDGHAFANERVAGDLAVLADVRVLLNFDKGTDLGVVAYFAAIEVDEPRQLDAFAQLHIGRNAEILAHSSIALPLSLSDRSAASSSLTTREPATPSFTGVSFLPTQSTK